ncbi:tetratricopeptide repeat protein, partial [Mesorhizobium sp.]|uniref:tetratricopeptide repeat protein n=1 Tax=Mesorhizobium sp. TaxID=1871066 RepID=UPI00345D1D31
MADYDKAIGLDPKDAKFYIGRGEIWHRKGNYDRALDDYNHVIDLDPASEDYGNRAMVLWAKGDYARAIADYDKATSIDPKYAYAFLGRGIVYLYSDTPAKAQVDFEQGAGLAPDNAYFAIWLDIVERRNG